MGLGPTFTVAEACRQAGLPKKHLKSSNNMGCHYQISQVSPRVAVAAPDWSQSSHLTLAKHPDQRVTLTGQLTDRVKETSAATSATRSGQSRLNATKRKRALVSTSKDKGIMPEHESED
ncbi:hypothetical protein AAC387_Pa02g3132 [Persea americana]